MFIEQAAGVVAKELWKERTTVLAYCKDLAKLLKDGKLTIFVFGHGGVGKSTFGRIISGAEKIGNIRGTYDLSSRIEPYSVEGKRFIEVKISPGQSPYKESAWQELVNAINKSNRFLVLNFVAWGFHSVERIELVNVPGYDPDATQDEFMDMFL